jgi:methyl-accepting chemotaxis protein
MSVLDRRGLLAYGLVLASVSANSLGAVFAIYYVYLVIVEVLQRASGQLLLSLSVCWAVGGLMMGTVLILAHLPALRALEQQRRRPEPRRLEEALREVGRIADNASRIALFIWLSAPLGLAVTGVWGADLPLKAVPRVVGVGIFFGPLTTLLVYCLVTLRARRVMLLLAAQGLTPAQVIAAVPRREQLRRRLVIFTVVAVGWTALLTWDVSGVLADRAFEAVLEQPHREAQQEQVAFRRRHAVVSGGILCVFSFGMALACAWLAGTLLGRPMRGLGDEAHRIAEGALGRPRLIPAEDELWNAAAAFTTMQDHLTNVLAQLQHASARIGSTTEGILTTSRRYEAGAADQARSLDHTSSTTEELAHAARHIAENAGSVAEIAHRTLAAARAGQASAESFLATISRMRHDNQAIATAVARLNKRVQQIGKIVEFITGVADKSDLLALNAELEGTKAGEMGQGFSLVAAEMRRLAENVLESTKEIEGLIEEVLDASGAAVTATEGGVRTTETGTSLAQQVSESLRQIVELAGRTSDAVRAISLATQQQQEGTDQLAHAMTDLLRITQQGHHTTQHVIHANADLSALSRDLRAVVERFQIDPPTPGGSG